MLARRLTRRATATLSDESSPFVASSDLALRRSSVETAKHLEDQIYRFLSGSSLNLIFEVDGFLCGFLTGSIFYTIDFGDTIHTVRIDATIHGIKRGEDADYLQAVLAHYKEQLRTNSERDMEWDKPNGVIVLSQSIRCEFLFPEYFDEFEEILDDLIAFAGKAKYMLRNPRKKRRRFNLFQRK